VQTRASKTAFIGFRLLSFIFPNRGFSMGYGRFKRFFLSPRSFAADTHEMHDGGGGVSSGCARSITLSIPESL
jgi:hypothetical protein